MGNTKPSFFVFAAAPDRKHHLDTAFSQRALAGRFGEQKFFRFPAFVTETREQCKYREYLVNGWPLVVTCIRG